MSKFLKFYFAFVKLIISKMLLQPKAYLVSKLVRPWVYFVMIINASYLRLQLNPGKKITRKENLKANKK